MSENIDLLIHLFGKNKLRHSLDFFYILRNNVFIHGVIIIFLHNGSDIL
jgi:hypothetical protein